MVCLGDSLTQGQVSADYVARLQRRWGAAGLTFVNAGVNGDLAFNVAQRLDDTIRQQPDVVTLLVGTNDVNAHYDQRWRARYRRKQHLPVEPTRDWYAEQVDTILTRLAAETRARVVVLDIPPLGEDLDSRMNALVLEYNATLRAVAARHGVACLPLHDRLVDLLPAGHRPPAYRGDIWLVLAAATRHLLLRQSWDAVAEHNGLALLTDHLHLSDRAADVVAALIGEVLPAGSA